MSDATHSKKLREMQIRNDIFGERDDSIIKAFLRMGGVAAYRHPTEKSVMGRGNTKNYFLHVVEINESSDLETTTSKYIENLKKGTGIPSTVAEEYVVCDLQYCKKVKFIDLEGKKVKSFV